ncbi:MAG: hypothetical protein JWO44_61 [Bacteroidetes bacterium]|nr:hypothetical protein [Bacteroidota bacterium]
MEDTLKAFIRENRNQMDIHEPADLWSAISLQLAVPQTSIPNPKKISWLKKGFFGAGATIAVIASAYLLNNKTEKPAMIAATTEQHDTTGIPAKEAIEATSPILPVAAEATIGTIKEIKVESTIGPVLPFQEAPPVPPIPAVEATPAPEVPQPVAAVPATAVNYESSDSSSTKKDTIFNGINKIEIEGGFFDVSVKAHNQSSVLFYEEHMICAKGLHSKITKYKVITEKKDSTLKIYIESENNKGIMIVGSLTVSGMMALTVPEGTEVIVHNVSGNVKLNGLKGKQVEVHTSSGDINTDDTFCPLNLSSVSGDIKSKNSNGNVIMSSSSGDQFVEGITGTYTTQSVSGNIHLANVKGDANLSSSSGDQVLSGIEGNIRASAVSGNITVSDCKGDLTLNTSSGDLTGKNNRLTAESKLQTVSGDIKMNFSNDKKDMSYDLNSVSGSLCVENGTETIKEEKRLLLKQGAIMIKGTTSSGDQRFK